MTLSRKLIIVSLGLEVSVRLSGCSAVDFDREKSFFISNGSVAFSLIYCFELNPPARIITAGRGEDRTISD